MFSVLSQVYLTLQRARREFYLWVNAALHPLKRAKSILSRLRHALIRKRNPEMENVSGVGRQSMSRAWWILYILMLAGCASTGQMKGEVHAEFLKKGSAALGLMNSYVAAKYDFEHGRIMKARSRVLAMKKSNKDYAKAHKLLKEKIEPARRRLFVHYLHKAKRAEENKLWSEAMLAYKQAKDITIKPEAMEKKQLEMENKLRQLRFNVLLGQRRKEDYILLINPNIYEPPKGVSLKDEVFHRKREQYEDDLDDRAARAYREAKRYLRKGMPEIAYIDIESYLRLQPDSDRGKKLLEDILEAIPKGLSIPPTDRASTVSHVQTVAKKAAGEKEDKKTKALIKKGLKKKPVKKTATKKQTSVNQKQVKRLIVPGFVSAEQIQALIQRGDLLRAKKFVQVYRREGGKNAAQLLEKVQTEIEKKASGLFAKGGVAFRQERLGRAIKYWSEAVALMPEEAEYVEALRRAHQLEERLALLRQASDEEPVAVEE
jgi:tetratricopeptide (TPR) repeat protein